MSLVKTAVQSASHSLPMEIKLVSVSEGNRWASVAVSGSLGKGRVAVWVETMVSSLARCTLRGVVVGCLLVTAGSSVE